MNSSMLEHLYAVVWCDSPRGLISFESYGYEDIPVSHTSIPEDTLFVTTEDELFDILRRKDGTKVSFPYSELQTYLGWKV